jgi:hypothetical protein
VNIINSILQEGLLLPNHPTYHLDESESQPVFIVGAERSGSTMFRLMLNAHHQIAVCPEFEFALEPLAEQAPFPGEEAFVALKRNWIFQDLNLNLATDVTWPSAMKKILMDFTSRENKTQAVAIVHKNFDQCPRIWSQAKYIHLLRDPRDVARSSTKMGWASDVVSGAERWIHAEECWETLKKDLHEHQICEIRFENLVASPMTVLKNVCDFMNIPMDNNMLDYAKHTSYDKPDLSIVQAWRCRLDDDELSRLEYILQDWLERRDYIASGVVPQQPSWWFQKTLRLNDWFARFEHRRSLYGTMLIAEDWWSRHCPTSTAWKLRIQDRMHSIWRGSLK